MPSSPFHRKPRRLVGQKRPAGRGVSVQRVCGLLLIAMLLWGPTAAWAAPAMQDGAYVVQPGDNLTVIAARLGVSPAALAAANGIRNPNFIYVGQRLIVPAGAPAPQPGGGVHVVQRGETLASIAARYGVSVAALVQINGLRNADFIWVGQQLSVPASAPAPAPTATPWPTPIPVPSPWPTVAPAPQPTATVSPQPTTAPQADVHVVQVGDMLSAIATRYNTTVNALMAANNLPNPNFIWVGQRLKVSQGGSPLPNPTPQPGPAPIAGRWIDVNLSRQRLVAYQGQTAVFTTLVSSGLPGTPTVVGTFAIQTKLFAQAMSGPGYYLPNVPYVMYFYGGYAIHGTYWHSNFGRPMSHGCVNVSTPAAAWLYGWASIGTPVVVHY